MKLLILGNHTCGNRGDSAILRGLLDAINILNPHAEVDVMSRYHSTSSTQYQQLPILHQLVVHITLALIQKNFSRILRLYCLTGRLV